MHHLIFDFDGVLGNTSILGIENRMKMEGATYQEAKDYQIEYFLKPRLVKTQKEEDLEAVERKKKWLTSFLSIAEKHDFPIFSGFIEVIQNLQENSDLKLGVVSSGNQDYILPSLKKTKLKIDHVRTFENSPSKIANIEYILSHWNVEPKEVFYFTDTVADVLELQEYLDLSKIIGCSWGYHGVDLLKTVLPENQILLQFEDISRVIN